MPRSFAWLKLTALLLPGILPSALAANPVGQAVNVSQNAFLDRNGAQGYLEQGGQVVLGDEITTGATGQVQILFQDGTKIAISQNSSLVIERVLFNSSGGASDFSVNAVGGAFRFLSGNSEPSTYSISAPQATMGIRGTEFDFAISTQGEIRVATFSGEVELCNRVGRCAIIPGGCSVAALDSSGQFIVPESEREEAALLDDGFPYIRNQEQLRRDYRTRVSNCARASIVRFDDGDERVTPVPPPAPGPTPSPRPNNPNVGGAQAGGDTSAGLGGSTAGETDAGLGGPSAPGDAEASDGQASAGGPGGANAGNGSVSAGGN